MSHSSPSTWLIVGAGLVGLSLAYGLARRGVRVTLLDAGEGEPRAAQGNFGLVWGQGKGLGMSAYADLSLDACADWRPFAEELGARSGVDVGYRGGGGVDLCLDHTEAEIRREEYAVATRARPDYAARLGVEFLDNRQLAECLPGIGGEIPLGSWSPHDGACDPLALVQALHLACLSLGVEYRPGWRASRIDALASGFEARSVEGLCARGERLLLAAGLDTARLGAPLGLGAPLSAVRGQLMVTERIALAPRLPTPQVRQTRHGGFLCGETHERVGRNLDTTPSMLTAIARDSLRIYPFLSAARVVRAWAALRVMTPDGCPVYHASARYPGAYAVSCHSGVTLASVHAGRLAGALLDDRLETDFAAFSAARFAPAVTA